MNRRIFLMSAAATTAAASEASRVAAREGGAVEMVVCDARHAESRRFAEALSRQGAAEAHIGAEGREPWREIAAGHVRCVAGMTTHSDYLVMADAARLAGLKLLSERLHDGRTGEGGYPGTLVSWMFG